MSNNIYDILKKFNNLDSVKMLTEGKKVCKDCGEAKCECLEESKGSKPDFLDMDKDGDTEEPMKKAAKAKSKGAIAEAVARVEQNLAEKYMGFKKTVAAIKKGGSAEDPEAVAAAIGRKKYGKAKFQKAAAAGKKLGEDGIEEDTRLAMRRGPGADMMRYEKDSPAPGAQQHRDATAKAAKAFRSAGGKMGAGDQVGRNALPLSQNAKGNAALGDKQLSRYSRTNEGEADEDVLTPKQKKFAKLAPPPDKITYADKIAGARKTDEAVYVLPGARERLEKEKAEKALPKPIPTGPGVDLTKRPANEGFPTVSDAQRRHKEQAGSTSQGKKTATKTGMKHERDWDKEEPTGERGRPVKDKFAKK